MRRLTAPLTTAALTAALVAPVLTTAPAATAAPPPLPTCTTARVQGDVDGDGQLDLLTPGPSSLVLNLSRGPVQTLRMRDLALGPGRYVFSSHVALGQLNSDGCADAIVTVVEAASDYKSGVQRTLVLLGSPTGLRADGYVGIPGATSPSGYRDGGPTALHRRAGTTTHDLWLGVFVPPRGSTTGGKVLHFRLAPRGASVAVTRLQTFTQSTKGVPGKSEAGDLFGYSLAAFEGGVVVGAPGEKVGKAKSAGSVTQLRTRADGSLVVAHTWTQSSRSVRAVKGAARGAATSRWFGSVVAAGPSGTTVAVIAPDARRKDGGGALVLRAGARGKGLHPALVVGENSVVRGYAVPGTAKSGLRIWSLAIVNDFLCKGSVAVAAGLPYKRVTGRGQVGGVVVVGVAGTKCRPRSIDAPSLAGSREGADLGANLAVVRASARRGGDRLVLTAPGASVKGGLGVIHVIGHTFGRYYTDKVRTSSDVVWYARQVAQYA